MAGASGLARPEQPVYVASRVATAGPPGTEEQKRAIVGGALRGEIVIVLGYTEPDSGSDVAAAKTRAERDGDEWLINGQKMFTCTAHLATHAFMLTRSNPRAGRFPMVVAAY